MRKGFTLIELSIVLVIIGLLIGGILAAQSMIGTSKIEAVTMQIGQFDAGVENFKTKYNALPGDAPAFGGNGDGFIVGGSGGNAATADDRFYSCEFASFWYDIDQQQYPGGNIVCGTSTSANINGLNKNVPASKFGKAGSFFIAEASSGAMTSGYADTTNPQNFYAIISGSQLQQPYVSSLYFLLSTSATANNSTVKPVDALALDKKVDDGLANSGNVLAGSISSSPGNPYIDTGSIHTVPFSDTTNNTCTITATPTNYDLTKTGYTCTPVIRIGASAGDPQ